MRALRPLATALLPEELDFAKIGAFPLVARSPFQSFQGGVLIGAG
jgi:hypothetical protein